MGKGNTKNTNLMSNKVDRFELRADYLRDSTEQSHCPEDKSGARGGAVG